MKNCAMNTEFYPPLGNSIVPAQNTGDLKPTELLINITNHKLLKFENSFVVSVYLNSTASKESLEHMIF